MTPDPTGPWIHSREEDHDGVLVYRRPGYPFPPARGRDGLRLDPDGGVVDLAIGRGDAPDPRPGGSWSRRPDGTIRLERPSGPALDVVSVAPDRLEIRPA